MEPIIREENIIYAVGYSYEADWRKLCRVKDRAAYWSAIDFPNMDKAAYAGIENECGTEIAFWLCKETGDFEMRFFFGERVEPVGNVPEGKTNFQWHLNLDGNQTTHVGMTVEGRKNKAVVSFATEGTCSPLAFGAVIEYPTLCRAASDKNAYLSAMQDRLLSRAKISHNQKSPWSNPRGFLFTLLLTVQHHLR